MFEFEDYIKFTVGEVVPAREGLRPTSIIVSAMTDAVGEVVPAREGLRPLRTGNDALMLL